MEECIKFADFIPTCSRVNGIWYLASLEFRYHGFARDYPNEVMNQGLVAERQLCTLTQLWQATTLATVPSIFTRRIQSTPCLPIRVSVHVEDCIPLWYMLLATLRLFPQLELIIVPKSSSSSWTQPVTALARTAAELCQRPRCILGTDVQNNMIEDIDSLPETLTSVLIGYRISGNFIDSFYGTTDEENAEVTAVEEESMRLAEVLWSLRCSRPDMKIIVEAPSSLGRATKYLVTPLGPLGLDEIFGCLPRGYGTLEVVADAANHGWLICL